MREWAWKSKSTQNLAVIGEWLEDFPGHPWALIPLHVFVVDADVKNGNNGPRSIEQAGGMEPTLTVRTPSGGFHHYFAADPSVPLATKNHWLPGVDLRYGPDGYVVVPYSKVKEGCYRVIHDVDAAELASIPEWIKKKLQAEMVQEGRTNSTPCFPLPEPEKKRRNVLYTKCNSTGDPQIGFRDIRPQVTYRFFRKKNNARIWNHIPIPCMKDRSQSGFEYLLAIALMNVGGTDQEVTAAYKAWCGKHGLEVKERFFRAVLPKARWKTAPYLADWQARQPKRRKHGTTSLQVVAAIEGGGAREPKQIAAATGLTGNTVRAQLKRLVAAGKLVKTPSGYATAEARRPQVESEKAGGTWTSSVHDEAA